MRKKIVSLVCAGFMTMGLSACGSSSDYGESFDAFDSAIDLDYTKELIKTISSFGDDPATGYRSAGSPAETETAEYLKSEMEKIGLKNVTMEETTLDTWTFKGANITFTNAAGKEKTIDLGSYQTTLQADNETCELVYVGEGTAADYEGIDVTGKLVLLDIDQNENWWINYPAYQAKVKGAKAVIAMSIYPEEGEDRIGVQDICGPADAPALGISEKDSKALQKAINESGGDSITVTLNADSTVTKDGTSHNVWGEIPGKTDETIFLFAHMDGYFHAAYDDAQGAAVSMTIAKAIIDSGYTPDKTIRVCMHGSEEWGVSGSEYDWSTGAYEEIMTNHPEWAEGAFAIVNNDGGYAVEGETKAGALSDTELMDFVKESVGEIADDTVYEWSYDKTNVYTEEFQWARMGIPAVVADYTAGMKYENKGYHSTYDSWDAQPLDEEGLNDEIRVFGKITLDLDALDVRPMNFTARLQDFEDTLGDTDEFTALLEEGYDAAAALEEKMTSVEESGEKADAVELNKQTQEIYKTLQDSLLGLDFSVSAVVRHELYQNNIELLDSAVASLEDGNIEEAYNDYISGVDWAWYYMYFDDETCKYMENQLFANRAGTWGDGLISYPHCDIGNVVRSLGVKIADGTTDVSAEIEELKALRDTQQQYLDETYASEKAGLEKAIQLMKEYSK
jgi:hypothetical protein